MGTQDFLNGEGYVEENRYREHIAAPHRRTAIAESKTNIVTSVEVSHGHAADSPQFKRLGKDHGSQPH